VSIAGPSQNTPTPHCGQLSLTESVNQALGNTSATTGSDHLTHFGAIAPMGGFRLFLPSDLKVYPALTIGGMRLGFSYVPEAALSPSTRTHLLARRSRPSSILAD